MNDENLAMNYNFEQLLKKQTFYNILKAFSSDTPQSIKRQNIFYLAYGECCCFAHQ